LNALVRKQEAGATRHQGGRHDISGKRESLSLSQHPGVRERERVMSIIKCEKVAASLQLKVDVTFPAKKKLMSPSISFVSAQHVDQY
jgi:hypothetical protein